MRRRGFTLIELLVVLAIIAVQAGLLMSVFHRSKAKVQQEVCASNLRQLYVAFNLYAKDWDGFLPPYHNMYWPDNPPNPLRPRVRRAMGFYNPTGLKQALEPYLRNEAVWFCPSDPWAWSARDFFCGGVNHRYTSYAVLDLIFREGLPPKLDPPYMPNRSTVVYDPSAYELAADAKHGVNRDDDQVMREAVHFGGINVLYRDGHVKWKHPK